MRRIILAVCLCVAAVMVVAPVSALELYNYHLRGVDEGLAAGALPPAGLYLIDDNWFMPTSTGHGVMENGSFHAGESNPFIKTGYYVNVPILLWSPGCKFLGATYAAAIAEPFAWTTTRFGLIPGHGDQDLVTTRTGALWGYGNTVLVPYSLSWKLPCDFYIRQSFGISFNDAQTSPGDSLAATPGFFPGTGGSSGPTGFFGANQIISKKDGGAYLWAGNDDYAFTPELGISWLHGGWNVSAEFGYVFYTKDTDTNYQNGDEFFTDLTLTYTCGKWTFGVGASYDQQLQDDKFNDGDGTGYHSQPNTKYANLSAGPLIGYNFGPCSLMFSYGFQIHTDVEEGADWFNVRLVVPLGNPFPVGK